MLLKDAVHVSTFHKLVSTLTFFCHILHFKNVRPKQKSNILPLITNHPRRLGSVYIYIREG